MINSAGDSLLGLRSQQSGEEWAWEGRQWTTSTLILNFFFLKVEDNMAAYLKRLLEGNTTHSVGGP